MMSQSSPAALNAFFPFSTHASQPREIDVEFLTFVERYATSLTRWDVLVYFGENPTAQANAERIASQVGRQVHPIEKELNDLVYLGVLHADKESQGIMYHLAEAPGIQRAVINLARCCQAQA